MTTRRHNKKKFKRLIIAPEWRLVIGSPMRVMKLKMADEVEAASKRCDIMVGSVATQWPICAMSAFLDACSRLTAAHEALTRVQSFLYDDSGTRLADEETVMLVRSVLAQRTNQ